MEAAVRASLWQQPAEYVLQCLRGRRPSCRAAQLRNMAYHRLSAELSTVAACEASSAVDVWHYPWSKVRKS